MEILLYIALGVVCIVCMLGAPAFVRWQSRQDRARHLAYPRIYYISAAVLCESLFGSQLIGICSFALEIVLHRAAPPFPPVVTQMLAITLFVLMVLGFLSLGVVGTIGIRATRQRTREQSRGAGS